MSEPAVALLGSIQWSSLTMPSNLNRRLTEARNRNNLEPMRYRTAVHVPEPHSRTIGLQSRTPAWIAQQRPDAPRRLGPVNTNLKICYAHGMELTEAQYERIASYLPVQRGNVSLSNRQVLNAILYVAEHGCKWRGLPARFGNWHTIYTRMNRWSKNGVLDQVFELLQREQMVRIKIEAVSMDSTIVKVHPDGTGALKKTAPKPSANPEEAGPPRFIWLPRMLERLSPSLSPLDRPTTLQKDVSC